MTVFRCRECGTVHDSFQALADCCDPLSGGDDDDQGAALALVADGGRIDVDDVDDAGSLTDAPDELDRYYYDVVRRTEEVANGTDVELWQVHAALEAWADEVQELAEVPDKFVLEGRFPDHVDDDDDDGLVGKLIPDGGTRSRRAERESDQGQSSLREHVRSSDTLAGVADQDDECENGTVACPGPDPDADVWPCFECFLAGVDDVEDADDFLADRSPRSLLEEEEGSA